MIIPLLAAALFSCAEPDSAVRLDDVIVVGNATRDFQMKSSQTALQINRDYIDNNFSGSLMQTLGGIPGVKAMSIGSGQSKPIIRGLGFNRMAVTENGIKHEGQQWGDDHGLEIDQFNVDRIELIKGPATLKYGSDAIGGVLNLYNNFIPSVPFEGSLNLFGRSNNEQLGVSAKIGGRKGRVFYRANITLLDYADYKVPTDSIQYYSYYIRLKDKRLRNTAGLENDGSVMLGYMGHRFQSYLRISDSYSKSGFFANAHGLEVRLSDIDYDHSCRDIDLPYQSVNHFKILNHTTWYNDHMSVVADLAFQNNLRKELSEPVSHGYMPIPDGSLERCFDKSTYTINLGTSISLTEHNELQFGVNTEYQDNNRKGWGFIIPDFETMSWGAYVYDRYEPHKNLQLNAGARFDAARTHIHSYYDWYETPLSETESVFLQRSAELKRRFTSVTWSAGASYNKNNWILKANIGKAFRMPIPKELGVNGVNYHIFRYERGNAELNPEESYQLDASVIFSNKKLYIQFDPYLNHFPNYIYLSPTADYVEGLQLYHYTQAKVLRYGFEAQLNYKIDTKLELELKGEYLYAEQQSGEKKGYTLPFSVPWSVDAGLKYSFAWKGDGFVGLNAHIVGKQDEIVPPEQPTPGYWTLNLTAGKQFMLHKNTLRVALHADNLLNKRYYDHTSYYRLIDVPEPGRNISMMIGLQF